MCVPHAPQLAHSCTGSHGSTVVAGSACTDSAGAGASVSASSEATGVLKALTAALTARLSTSHPSRRKRSTKAFEPTAGVVRHASATASCSARADGFMEDASSHESSDRRCDLRVAHAAREQPKLAGGTKIAS
eukprot:scaffold131150_cov66-Phaeocystis_antarctica.AAC.2